MLTGSKIITFVVASLVHVVVEAISHRRIFFTLTRLLPRVDVVVREYDVILRRGKGGGGGHHCGGGVAVVWWSSYINPDFHKVFLEYCECLVLLKCRIRPIWRK